MNSDTSYLAGRSLRISKLAAVPIIVAAVLSLFGWPTGVLSMSSWRAHFIPMDVSTTLLFLMHGVLLLVAAYRPQWKLITSLIVLAAVVTIALGGQALFSVQSGESISQMLATPSPNNYPSQFPGTMAPLTAAGFVAAGFSLILCVLSERHRTARIAADSLAAGVFLLGLISTLGYLYGTPLFYSGETVPIALPTALLFILLAVAIIAHSPAELFLLRLLSGQSTHALLIRAFLPSLALQMLVMGWVDLKLGSSFPDANPAIMTGLDTLIALLTTSLLIGIIARKVGKKLDAAKASVENSQAQYRELVMRQESEINDRTDDLANALVYKQVHEDQLTFLLDLSQRAPGLSEKEVCDTVLDMGVKVTKSRIGYLHFLNDDQNTISLGTWNAEALRHCDVAHDSHYPLADAGIWADCARYGHAVIHNDYQHMPEKKSCPEGHAHLIRHMSVPVLSGDKVRMIIGVGNKDTDYTDDDVRELQWVADEAQKIVERRRAEAALLVRTHELSAALEAAKAADQSKDVFLANMSHELRTPLNIVIGLSGLALRSNPDSVQGDYLSKIGDAGRLLSGIINDILDLSKIAAGRMELETTTFSLRQLMERCISGMGHKAVEKGLSLTGKINDDVPDVLFGDPLRLEQILLNLLSNAIKFTPAGSVAVRLGLHDYEETRICLDVEVEDNGIGMSPSEVEQLFKPFSQADASMARKYGGTGLGLAICRRLTELMDGDISVTSREGKGSNFRVRVWIALGDAVNLPEPALSQSAATQSLPVGYQNVQVLVVEDHPLNREIVQKLLDAVGITAGMATNGQEAVDILAVVGPNHFDLVLMDVQMPVMDGLTATREIRTRKGFKELPIIGMTAHIMEHEKQISTAAGMNDHIGKPFDTGFFYHILAKWIPESKRQELLKSDVSVELRADVGLSALHSIDTEGGLERFVGNEQRYRHWLIKFAEDSSGDLIDIRNALARGELEVVRKSAHSIKGQTGMLGLTDLHTIAAAIEAAVAHGPPPEDMFVSMEQEGKRVCREIASAFALVAQTDHADRTLVHNPDQLKRAERRQRPRANEKLILLIDDDLAVLETLDECLQNRFQTRLAARGLDGLKAAQVQPQPDLILLDIELPDIQGYDICSALKANPQTAAIPVIFLSSHTNVLDITRGLEVGAVDYVTKPVASPILMARVQTHLRLRETGDLLRNQNTHLEIMVGERTRDLEARTLELQRSKDLTIVALGSIAETRDNETGNHIHRTSAYVEVLARRLAVFPAFRDTVSMEQWEVIWKSAPLHDIGKVGIPDHILLKPGKLTPEEFEVMKRHTVLGRDAILSAEARVHSEGSFLRVASEIAYFHHERWNGQGYPEGIAGEEIPLSARLMAVADVYDALTSNRVYKAAISHDDSVDIIRAERGGHFDPRITDCFLEMADDFRTIASAFSDAPTGDKYE